MTKKRDPLVESVAALIDPWMFEDHIRRIKLDWAVSRRDLAREKAGDILRLLSYIPTP